MHGLSWIPSFFCFGTSMREGERPTSPQVTRNAPELQNPEGARPTRRGVLRLSKAAGGTLRTLWGLGFESTADALS